MDTQIWPRLGALSGILFVVLIMAGTSMGVEGIGGALAMVGFVLFIPFIGYLWSVLRRAEGEAGWLSATAFGAGLAGVTIKLGSIATEVPAAKVGLDAGVARALQEIANASFILTMLPLSALAAAVAIVTLKTRVLPTWIGWMSAAIAPVLLVNGMMLGNDIALGFMLFMLWTVLLSAVLTLRGEASVASTAIPEPVRAR